MATRPQNHITGDSAITDIKAKLLPRSWIVNEQIKDYGLDLQIEVCIDNHTTGKFFFIQSKGTELVAHNGEISYEISVDKLLDYKQIPLPVMVVYYSLTDDVFWGIWANGIYDTLTEEQKEQESYSIHFTRNNIIDTEYLESIGSYIQREYTNRIDFWTENAQLDLVRLHHQLFKLLDKTFPNHFSLHNKLACHIVHVAYIKEDGSISLCVKDRQMEIMNLSWQYEEAFLWYPETNLAQSPFGIQVFIAAMGMLYVNKKLEYPYDIYSIEIIDALFPRIPEYCWLDWVYNLPIERMNILEQVVYLSVRPEYRATTPYVQLALLFRSEQEIEPLREKHLREMIKLGDSPQEKGRMCYNLANNIRAKNCRDAMPLYLQAAKHFPKYLTIYYWWKEVAGVLFMTKHYYFSQKFYEKALSLTNDPDKKKNIILLIADTCLYQKDIKTAGEWIGKYFDICAEENRTVPPKVLLLSKVYESYEDLIEKHGWTLCQGDAWFDEGLRCQNAGKYEEAMNAFLIAWAYNVYDYEALQGALAMAINVGNVIYIAYIIETIRTSYSKSEINALVDEIIRWKLPDASKNGLLAILNGEMPITTE